MHADSECLVRRLEPADAPSMFAAVNASLPELAYWMPWCTEDFIALTHNIASQRVALSLGATRDCEARNRLYFHGRPHDAVVYSLVPDDTTSWVSRVQ